MSATETPPIPSPDATPATPRRGRWLKVALVVSLALNFLVIGSVVGRMVLGHGFGRDGPWAEGRRMFRELPDDRRNAILAEMRAHRGDFDAHRADVKAAREAAAGVLARADASDTEIVDAFVALGREEGEAVAALREVIGEVALVMTPDERAEFARRVIAREPRHYGRRWEEGE